MNILIDNAGYLNKGAELMLRSVIEKIKEKYPSGKCVITPASAGGRYSHPIGDGLYIYQKNKYVNLIPQKYLKKLFLIKSSKINLLLDAGGFQFSDQWIETYNKRSNNEAEKYYRRLKKNGTKLVFLPQSFGPFTHPLAIERINTVYKYADLLFAREKTSYDHLTNLFGKSKKIFLKPDFTNLLKPYMSLTEIIESGKYVCVIPNRKMISDTNIRISENYIEFMASLCQLLIDKGEELVLLNHADKGDEEILDQIQIRLSKKVLKLTNLTAMEAKGVIGRMKIVISSRYHGAVSGLSQGVCTFCTGWSHKYPNLLADYQVEENFLDVLDLHSSKIKIIQALSDTNNIYHPNQVVITQLEKESKDMWELVWQL